MGVFDVGGLVGCEAPWTPFVGATGGACSPWVGVGDGCSPPFVLSHCVLAFVCGRGWWWVLALMLALVRVAWLCAPIRRWWWVLTLLVSPCWVLVSAACGG